MFKFIKFIMLTLMMFTFAITITSLQKTLKSGNHRELNEVFDQKESLSMMKIGPKEYLGLTNIPEFIFKSSSVLTENISEITSSLIGQFLHPLIVKLIIHMTPIVSMIFWIVWAYILIEFLFSFLIIWIYHIFMIATLIFFGGILYKVFVSNEISQDEDFIIKKLLQASIFLSNYVGGTSIVE